MRRIVCLFASMGPPALRVMSHDIEGGVDRGGRINVARVEVVSDCIFVLTRWLVVGP